MIVTRACPVSSYMPWSTQKSRAHGTGAFLILAVFAGTATAGLALLGARKHFTGMLGLGALLGSGGSGACAEPPRTCWRVPCVCLCVSVCESVCVLFVCCVCAVCVLCVCCVCAVCLCVLGMCGMRARVCLQCVRAYVLVCVRVCACA